MNKDKNTTDKTGYKNNNGHTSSPLTPSLRKLLLNEHWQLGDREYKDLDADLLFQNLENCQAKTLTLDLNKKSAILKEIIRPDYTRLTSLYIGDNNIASLDPLPSLKAPLLQNLYLNHNKITSIKPLRRVIFPDLQQLNLNGNNIQDENWLAQCHFPKAKRIALGYPKQLPLDQVQNKECWKIGEETKISSSKNKAEKFTKKMYLTRIEEPPRCTQPKNLFKTFES